MSRSEFGRVAVIHDWLTGMRGGESVLEAILETLPQAELFTLFHFRGSVSKAIESRTIHTSWLQAIAPRIRDYRKLLPLFPSAVRQWDLCGYDLIVSSSHCVAKGVRARGTPHLCYCHTPTRYYWSDYHAYRDRLEFGLLNPLVRTLMPYLTNYLRLWDLAAARRVDHFVANSSEVQKRIQKYYRRDSDVIHPPVAIENFKPAQKRGDYLLSVGRLVPYKRVDLIIESANRLKVPLKISGEGPERARLEKLAGPTVELLGRVPAPELPALYAGARAFIFAAEEDFGIVPVEAMASGVPVVAYGRGGINDSVVPGETGVFFMEQTVDSLVAALEAFRPEEFDTKKLRGRAEQFSEARFHREISALALRLLSSRER